jgi:peptidyl-prolyl cis-trans isomerase C
MTSGHMMRRFSDGASSMKTRTPAPIALLLGTFLAGPVLVAQSPAALAQSAEQAETDPNRVVAKVNGTEITVGDLRLVMATMGQQARQLPPEQQLTQIVSALTDIELVSSEAAEEGLDDDEGFKRQMALLRKQELAERKLAAVGVAAVSDETVQNFYNDLDENREEEVRARHILVKTEEEAQAIKSEVDGGADFAELAKEKSTGPSGQNGGDLGYFTKERMVAPFAEAAFSMESGAVSDPVETEFGWHVIKVEDKRMQSLPPLEEIRDRVEQAVAQEARQAYLARLREGAELFVIDNDGKEIPFGGAEQQ